MKSTSTAFSELLTSRRSVRDFTPEPIPPNVLRGVLEESAWAPSWSNTQPYFLAVASGESRDRISSELCRRYDLAVAAKRGGLSTKLRVLAARVRPDGDLDTGIEYPDELQPYRRQAGYGLYKALGIERHDRAAREVQMRRNFEFFGAPTVIFVFAHKGLAEFAVLDVGIMLQTMMLSAQDHGLGTCAQGALATWAGPVRAEFDIPADHQLVCGLALGYPSDHPVNSFNPGRRPIPRIERS